MVSKALLVVAILLVAAAVHAKPPQPPRGFKWVRNWAFSDEFNGNQLNQKKWNNFHPWWNGRYPGMFSRDTVSVGGGMLRIRNGINEQKTKQRGHLVYKTGAVTSKNKNAPHGYYEVRMKASSIMMGSAMFLANMKKPLNGSKCVSYSQELDVIETVGGQNYRKWFSNYALSNHMMNSNTHYRHMNKCKGWKREKYETTGAHKKWLKSRTCDGFHTYGAWWKNAHQVTFYADDQKNADVWFKNNIDKTNPFDRGMMLVMCTETYESAKPYPSRQQLRNNRINTTYFDWVRAWRLVRKW